MLNAIYSFFGSVLKLFSGWFGGSYLLGLILFAIIIKLLMLPFGIKQQKTSIRQAKLRPREMAIRKKYAGRDDKPTQQKMQQEVMELYQQEGYNPMGGCLPMILQMVIILLLYQAIIYPLQHVVGMDREAVMALQGYFAESGKAFSGSYQEIQVIKYMIEEGKDAIVPGFQTFLYGSSDYAANSAAIMQSLEKAFDAGLPNFDLFGITNFLAETPWQGVSTFPWTTNAFLIFVPLLNFGTQFGTMKLTKKLQFQPMQQGQQAGCSGKIMDWVMPAFTLYIAFIVPAAIGIYWIFNNALGVAQTLILHKVMPLPQFTEEDFKAAEKEMKSSTKSDKLPKAVEGVRSNPNSLHTIDFEEEDYAELPEYESVYDKTPEEQAEVKTETETKLNGKPVSKIGNAPLKKKKK